MDNTDNISYISLGAVLSIDDSFIDLLERDIGAASIRNDDEVFVEID